MVHRNVFYILSSGICVWSRAAKSYIRKLLILQKRALWLIYFAPSDAHVIPLFTELKTENMIYFDKVANLMHDIWIGLAPSLSELFSLGQMKFTATTDTKHAAKENYFRKQRS